MNSKSKYKTYDNHYMQLLKVPAALLSVLLAVIIGVQTGNIMFYFNTKLVGKIDIENFKKTLNLSLPIIEIIYNSGKSSVSFPREVKNLFSGIFNIDFNSPVSILNAQSTVFKSYYNSSADLHMGRAGNGIASRSGDGTGGMSGTGAAGGAGGIFGTGTEGTAGGVGGAGGDSVVNSRENGGAIRVFVI